MSLSLAISICSPPRVVGTKIKDENHKALHKSIEANADVEITNKYNSTALHLSSWKGHGDIVKALIEANADVNIKNRDGNTALHLSSWCGHIDAARTLINAGADANVRNKDNLTALHWALENGHTDIAKALINAGADVYIKFNDNNTALHVSSLKGHTKVVQVLIENKADLDVKNGQQLKPVFLAALNGHTETIQALLATGGAAIDANDPVEMSSMYTILMESDLKTLHVVMAEMNSNVSRADGSTILHLAARLGCHEHMKCLIHFAWIPLNPRDTFAKTPLHCASEIGNIEAVSDLLHAGCELHVLDKTLKSVLHIASIYGHLRLVKLFISLGADPCQVDRFRRSSLHYAILYRHEDIVHELLRTNDFSKYNTKDCDGKVLLDYLHECERDSLLSKTLNGDANGIQILSLKGGQRYCPNISKCPHTPQISEIPYIGSVNAIKRNYASAFINHVKKEVEDIIRCAIPAGDSVKVIGVGSSFEGTKNGLPDELDFIIELFHINSRSSGQEGYNKMERDEKEVKRLNIIGSYGMWLWQKLMAYWSECETKGKTTRRNRKKIFKMPLPPQRHPDRKTCTTWTWLYSDGVFNDLPVSIDFVPAIETDISKNKVKSTWLMTEHEMILKKCYIVPKIPHENSLLSTRFRPDEVNELGRVSYPTLEVEHLVGLEPRIKKVYITAKCLRKPELCGFKIKNEKGDVRKASEFVTSYRLKSVFLHLVPVFLKSNISLGKMVLMVYEQLEMCLERENIPMFFDPEVNILAGSKLNTEESLTVARMMTMFVRSLYERDFLSEMKRDSDEGSKALKRGSRAHTSAIRAEVPKEVRIKEKKKSDLVSTGCRMSDLMLQEPEPPPEMSAENTKALEKKNQAQADLTNLTSSMIADRMKVLTLRSFPVPGIPKNSLQLIRARHFIEAMQSEKVKQLKRAIQLEKAMQLEEAIQLKKAIQWKRKEMQRKIMPMPKQRIVKNGKIWPVRG